MVSTATPPPSDPAVEPEPVLRPRGYQLELLNESLHRNIIIALDTGSGKTHIAMLRMKHEVETNSSKISWFLAPTVTLIEQQSEVIRRSVSASVGLISGASEPDQWKDASLWSRVLKEYKIMVSTPQILLNALHHGYINLGRDIGLIVFDEAHHASGKHPYNMIMQSFYHTLDPRQRPADYGRPSILGLTASPIYGGHVESAFDHLEKNLDSFICSSKHNRDELKTYVHRPQFKHVVYNPSGGNIPSANLVALREVIKDMSIEDDPYVISLRSQLARLPAGEQRNRVDQRLSKTLNKEDTFTHKGMRDFERAAADICQSLGPWAADWYITTVTKQAKIASELHTGIMASWHAREKKYLLDTLDKVKAVPFSTNPDDLFAGLSHKVRRLVHCLEIEERDYRNQADPYSGIIFVTRRDAVLALAEVLSRLPSMKQHFRVGCLLGNSGSVQRHAFLDITRTLLKQTASETLNEFRTGDKNLIVSTAVAEEGIDIQACGCVVRFDPPDNMVAWAQSRGRARKQRSTFILMLDELSPASNKIADWVEMEKKMIAQYTDQGRVVQKLDTYEINEDHLVYRIDETGAALTLDAAISHLYHFCAVLPHSGHGNQLPLFDLDPPDFEEAWHSLDPRPPRLPYPGPWGAVCTLPRQLPSHLRKFSVDRVYTSKQSAINHVAFFAYVELHKAGLLNDNLLPLTSVIAPDADGEVKVLLQEVEKRAGTANVPVQMDPWMAPRDREFSWWFNEVAIKGLPSLYMFTPTQLPTLADDELPTLYVPGKEPLTVTLTSTPVSVDDNDVIEAARLFTQRMFNILHATHMAPGKMDFSYLFLPTEQVEGEQDWEARRRWIRERLARSNRLRFEDEGRSNVEALCKAFGYTLDLALVRSNDKFGKVLRFVGWHDGPVSDEEQEELLSRYDGFPDLSISYPLMVAQPFPRRANFMIPLSSDSEGLSGDHPFLVHPKYATVDLVHMQEVELSLLLPSLLRFLSVALTVNSMRQALFASTDLYNIPFALLRTALTAPVSQEPSHYQRLETLGDTVLKYITGIQLYSQYPLWHEGYLSRRKDHAVSNNRLAKEAIRLGLHEWIIRDRFVPRKWKPHYVSDLVDTAAPAQNVAADQADDVEPDVDVDSQKEAKKETMPSEETKGGKKKKQTQGLSTKMLADVMEALLGAAFEFGGFDLAIECVKIFGLGLPSWDTVANRVETALSRVEELDDVPPQLAIVEDMVGYVFTRKTLLVEALTHASYTGDIQTISYERLEFLGDAALDMVVTDYLYHAPGKNYSPGYMHIYKEALVNAHLLGYICVNTSVARSESMPTWTPEEGVTLVSDSRRVHLHQCLLHSSVRILEDQEVTFIRYEKTAPLIQEALEKGTLYPWAALTSLQAPKFLSDMLESVLGAVFLDSSGNLDVVRQVLRKLGIMAIMERIVADEVDVLHPVSRLGIWAAKNEKKWEIKVDKVDGNVVCTVYIDEEEVSSATQKFRGKVSVNEVRFAAAEDAIRKLHVIEQEEPEDLNDADWGDVPEYGW